MNKTKLTAAAVASLGLSGGVAAAAAGSLPTQSDEGRARAEERTGFSVPVTPDHPTPDAGDPPSEAVVEVEAPEETPEAPPTDTHGATVSAVAQGDSTLGREHGEAVSSVASENGQAHAADPETPEPPSQAATPGTVPDQASAQGAAGAANAQGRGRP